MDPVRRLRRLSERDAADRELSMPAARSSSVSRRLVEALELSDVARELASSLGAAWVVAPESDLAAKAGRYPLGK